LALYKITFTEFPLQKLVKKLAFQCSFSGLICYAQGATTAAAGSVALLAAAAALWHPIGRRLERRRVKIWVLLRIIEVILSLQIVLFYCARPTLSVVLRRTKLDCGVDRKTVLLTHRVINVR
jgi:hypothetical protein